VDHSSNRGLSESGLVLQSGRYASSRRTAQEIRRHRETLQSGSSPGRRRTASASPLRERLDASGRNADRASVRPLRAEDLSVSSRRTSRQLLAAKRESDKLCPTPVARGLRPVIASHRQPTRPPWLRQVSSPDRTAHVERTCVADASFDWNAGQHGLQATRRLCPSDHGRAIGTARVEIGAAWSFRPRRLR